ncbi:MAG TPA: MFS transporter, partial [Gemmatimonadota bacterium]|nr:MFS transporter [Gemmatimonadota bacterium]
MLAVRRGQDPLLALRRNGLRRSPAPGRRLSPAARRSRNGGRPGKGRRTGLLDIRSSEWPLVWALFGWFFLLTSLQHLIKPARNAFFLSTAGAANLPWAYIAGAVVSAVATLAYGRWIAPLGRRRQILGTLAAVAASLFLFWLTMRRPTAWSAGSFYVWVNVFTLFLVSQFFLVVNDVFDPRQAKRLLGFVGAGGLAGGVAGSAGAGLLAHPLGS